MRSGAGPARLKIFGTVAVAVTVGFTAVSCSGDGPPADRTAPSTTPASAPAPSMTVEEAYRKVPMDGTKDLPVAWDLAGAPDTEETLAARRALVYRYWLSQATDWTPIVPLGKFIFTDSYYQDILAPFEKTTDEENPSIGPIWIKYMGVEKTGPDTATVTFCTDLGHWHEAERVNYKVRKNRANLESYEMKRIRTGDGEQRWVADRVLDPHNDLKPKYGDACTKFATHQP